MRVSYSPDHPKLLRLLLPEIALEEPLRKPTFLAHLPSVLAVYQERNELSVLCHGTV
jgi:hypothetical protein